MLIKVNPKINQEFLKEIRTQTSRIIEVEGIKIKTCKNVFPPQSSFSGSSEKLHTLLGDLKDVTVVDVGTGTGVQAIQAVKHGARHVIALDISPEAVLCAKENVKLNGVEDKVSVIESDLFNKVDKSKRFNVVIANLPITDFPLEGIIESALYDADYKIHKRFLTEVGEYLAKDGVIIITHINFKGEGDFEEFENLLRNYGYASERYVEIHIPDWEYVWRIYRVGRIKKN